MAKDLTKAAPPLELILKGGDPNKVALWGCGTCHMSAPTRNDAISCCAPRVCDECGAETLSYCKPCSDKKQHAKAQATYDKAEKVLWVNYEGHGLCCDHCDEYFFDLDGFLDAHQDDEEVPTWAWGTYEVPLQLDAETVIVQQLEQQEFYENAYENVPTDAINEMQAFFKQWLEKVKLKSYMLDNGVAVQLDKEVEEYERERRDQA